MALTWEKFLQLFKNKNPLDISHLVTTENYNDISFWMAQGPYVTSHNGDEVGGKPSDWGTTFSTVTGNACVQIFRDSDNNEWIRRGTIRGGWANASVGAWDKQIAAKESLTILIDEDIDTGATGFTKNYILPEGAYLVVVYASGDRATCSAIATLRWNSSLALLQPIKTADRGRIQATATPGEISISVDGNNGTARVLVVKLTG